MKFIHMADLHIGGWRDPKMSSLTLDAFKNAIDDCLKQEIDFLIIAGDLFNTSLPNIDYIKATITQLKRLKENNIPVYIIPGSHDFSPSGKTMLDVLEQADMLINVVKAKQLDNGKLQLIYTEDSTGAKLTGMLGKKNMLEKSYYEALDYSNLDIPGFKIFLFHTALDELKPEELEKMQSSPVSMLPKGFDYYAGGHVHIIDNKHLEGYKNIVYPGPLFPNSFAELQKLSNGGYFLYEDGDISYKVVIVKETLYIEQDCTSKTPEQIDEELVHAFDDKNVENKIILLRLKGKLKLGKLMDINMKSIIHSLYEKGAYFVMKNTSSLSSEDFEEVKKQFTPKEVEQEVISEHLGQIKIEGMDLQKEKDLIHSLIKTLSSEKDEGETNATYEDRIMNDVELLN